MAQTYLTINNALGTLTAAPTKVAIGATVKTLLQLTTPSTTEATIFGWAISLDGLAASGSVEVEVYGCTVAGGASTGTGTTPSPYSNPNSPASLCISGAAATCFSPSTEGTSAGYRPFDLQIIPYNGLFVFAFPLGREPGLAVSQCCRIRVTATVTGSSAYCYLIHQE